MHTQEQGNFTGLGIAPRLLDVLEHLGFRSPTPIQRKSIPATVTGKDMVGVAQTGTGKTLAFGIPMIQRLAQIKGRGLVLLPTRELAIQVNDSLTQVGKPLGLRTAVLIGGEGKGNQMRDLARKPHIIVATPGRLIDYMHTRVVDLRDIRILVIDEADMMMDMGFLPQLKTIVDAVPAERQTMLFSATMPAAILQLASRYLSLPIRIEVAPSGTPAELVNHEMIIVEKDDRFGQLAKILDKHNGSVLVFSRTKHGAKKLRQKIAELGHSAAEIHSNRSQVQRQQALEGFKTGKFRVLVATDIAARGIDVRGIELVLNFDLPSTSEDYVHRIGRTGRAGQPGLAISFALPNQMSDVRAIEQLIKKSIPQTRLAKTSYMNMPSRPSAAKPAPRQSSAPSRREAPRQRHQGPKPADRGRQENRPRHDGGKKPFGRRPPQHSRPPLTDRERFQRSLQGDSY